MKTRNFILILALTLGIGSFGAARGLAYMRAEYAGACSPLDGFPGLLQKVNLLAQGTCSAPVKGQCSGTCTTTNASGKKVTGNCSKSGGNCVCVAP